jgi:parvulin-like peptidyl-prolyl isomerase
MTASSKTPSAKPGGWRDFTQVNLKRSLILSGAGAIIGLLMAGFALFTAKGTSTLVVPPEDVALVNQQPISRSDFYLQIKTLYTVDYAQSTPAQRQTVLNQMIREELYVQRGKELDVASVDTDVRSAMVNAVEQGIAADVMASNPSEDKLRAWYEQHKDAYSDEGMMTVRDLVFPPAAAAAASQALKAGQPVDAVVAQDHGKDSGRVSGQEFYFAAKIHLGDPMFAVARALNNGQASDPLPSSDGAHVLYMANNIPPVPQAYDQARPSVLADYKKAQINRLQNSDESFFRKRANVLIAPDLRQ